MDDFFLVKMNAIIMNIVALLQVFDTAYKLYNHRYAVHRLQECRCEFCGGTYKNTKLLQVHKRVSHTELYEASKKASQQQQILDYAASLSAVSSQAEHYPVI